jgi:hypothetical protein
MDVQESFSLDMVKCFAQEGEDAEATRPRSETAE